MKGESKTKVSILDEDKGHDGKDVKHSVYPTSVLLVKEAEFNTIMVNINVIGRLGADAELINGKNGQFASFRLAVDDRKNSEKTTTWFRVTLNGERVGKLVEYLTKGKLVNVIGTESVGTYQAKDRSVHNNVS